ncbi:hypothetical protein KIN20_006282 [Parelaphostrongylus tenuis]|uniref:Uncharacterized protein n=1 Tax=Parelaphostrongylus tenuis TaxID=148309 RepID=A0AAD5QI68_PARTN|nr:hypothetical protein KIN20_006282 [Parelaphostrongylus tenuis]
MYAFTAELSTDGMMQQKLDKLIGVWEGHNYFNDHCFKQLRNPGQIFTSAKAVQAAEYAKHQHINEKLIWVGERWPSGLVMHGQEASSRFDSRYTLLQSPGNVLASALHGDIPNQILGQSRRRNSRCSSRDSSETSKEFCDEIKEAN